MYKVRVHIANSYRSFCKHVYVDIELPAVPRIGEYLIISSDHVDRLERIARAEVTLAQIYYPHWFTGSAIDNWITKENLNDLSFFNAQFVSAVKFEANSEIISIELDEAPE